MGRAGEFVQAALGHIRLARDSSGWLRDRDFAVRGVMGEAHPEDFGIRGIRMGDFRQQYGPAAVARPGDKYRVREPYHAQPEEPLPHSTEPETWETLKGPKTGHWQHQALFRERRDRRMVPRDTDDMRFLEAGRTSEATRLNLAAGAGFQDAATYHDHQNLLDEEITPWSGIDDESARMDMAREMADIVRKGRASPIQPQHVPTPTHEAHFEGKDGRQYVLTRHSSATGDHIMAWHNGQHVGGVQLFNPGSEAEGSYIASEDDREGLWGRETHAKVYTHPTHERNGLGTAMSRFAQFSSPGDPIRSLGVSPNRTEEGDKLEESQSGLTSSGMSPQETQNALVDPTFDPRVQIGIKHRKAHAPIQGELF